ncbi:MAG: hypothetical protein WC518_03635 [Patescibacteria group bacterium]
MKDFNIDQLETLDDLPHTHWVALGNQLGGVNVVKALLRHEMTAEIKETVRKLFDKNSRFIPFPGLKAAFCDAGAYYVNQPSINYGEILERVRRHLAIGLRVKAEALSLPSAEEFEVRAKATITRLAGDPRTANAVKGIWLPTVLPAGTILPEDKGGYGATLKLFVDGVRSAYEEAFEAEGRKFTNYRETDLAGEVSIVAGSRHECLLAALAKEPVVGVTLLPFGGYSVDACRETFVGHELSAQIPEWMLLGGGLDTAVAYMAYAKELCRDAKTPIVRCPALQWQSYSLRFLAYDSYANFDYTDYLSYASDDYSASVFCLG